MLSPARATLVLVRSFTFGSKNRQPPREHRRHDSTETNGFGIFRINCKYSTSEHIWLQTSRSNSDKAHLLDFQTSWRNHGQHEGIRAGHSWKHHEGSCQTPWHGSCYTFGPKQCPNAASQGEGAPLFWFRLELCSTLFQQYRPDRALETARCHLYGFEPIDSKAMTEATFIHRWRFAAELKARLSGHQDGALVPPPITDEALDLICEQAKETPPTNAGLVGFFSNSTQAAGNISSICHRGLPHCL